MISDCNVKLALYHFTEMKQIHSDYMVNFCQDIKKKLNLKWFETTKNKNLKRVQILISLNLLTVQRELTVLFVSNIGIPYPKQLNFSSACTGAQC